MAFARSQHLHLCERFRVVGHDNVDALVASARAACQHGLGICIRRRLDGTRLRKQLVELGSLLFVQLVLERDDGVVLDDLAILDVDDVIDGIVQPEPREQQSRASRNADDGHDETLLVAEDVAARHFPREGKALPQRSDPLEQDALARFRSARQHEGRRLLAQRGSNRSPCGKKRNADGQPT